MAPHAQRTRSARAPHTQRSRTAHAHRTRAPLAHRTRAARAPHAHGLCMACAWLVQVAQLYGRKQWTLHPPGSSAMQPSRVPYEESSVFSEEPGKLSGGAAAEGGAGAAEGET